MPVVFSEIINASYIVTTSSIGINNHILATFWISKFYHALKRKPHLCFIKHVKTGKVTKIVEKNGTFEVGIWVPKPAQETPFQGQEAPAC